MGCDGGTIPRRDELVRVKKKDEVKDKESELVSQWRYCAISNQLLQPPVVTCGLGRLYNKLALIEALLNKELLPDNARHIKSLKDVKQLNLTPNPEYNHVDQNKQGFRSSAAPYTCPVIGLEMSGKFRFIALWSCGCVFSERVLKELNTGICHKCQKPFANEDIIILNGTEDDLVQLKIHLKNRHNSSKKNKKLKIKIEPTLETPVEDCDIKSEDIAEKELPAAVAKDVVINNSKLQATKRPGALIATSTDEKKVKKNYSVAKDPQVSDVYKSLFTSHRSEQEQNRAHWVTYNPFYN